MENKTPKLMFVLLLLAFFLVSGYMAFSGYLDYKEMRGKLESIRSENERLRSENEQLRMEIEALKKDEAAMEKAARERLGLVKEDEVIYRLPE